MCNGIKQIEEKEPVKKDNACFCGCMSSNESDPKIETTSKENCCE